jgi:hypothetical protein
MIVAYAGWGCGGRIAARKDEGAGMRTAKSYGPDASTLASSQAVKTPLATVTKKPDRRGEYEAAVKTIAQGKSDCLRWTCMLVGVLFCAVCP